MLSQMINRPLDENTQLIKPEAVIHTLEIQRPELTWYQLQSENLSLQNNLLQTENRPKVSLFFQGGLGRPGLNMLDDVVKGYYIGGLRFFWPLSGYYTVKNEREDIVIRQQAIQLNRETFLYQTQLRVSQENAEIRKLQELLSFDDEIIELRNTIKNTALTQMENGVITSSDYLEEVNGEDAARQNKILHEIQLLMAQYALQVTVGI
jgi:outer membrane protein TolC